MMGNDGNYGRNGRDGIEAIEAIDAIEAIVAIEGKPEGPGFPVPRELYLLVDVATGDLVFVDFLLVERVPAVGDVGQHKWDEEADNSHGAERELTAARVGNGKAALQIGC